MKARPSHPLWTTSFLLLALLSCGKPDAPEATSAPPPEPPIAASPETSRPVPRRLVPIIITNQVVPEAVPAATNTAPIVTCGAAQTFSCSSADGTQAILTAHVEDVDGQALSVIWSVNGKDRYTQQVPAGGPPTSAELTFSYDLTPGEHRVRVTVLDGSLSASCETTVTVQKDTQEPVIACPTDTSVRADPGQCSAIVTFNPRATDNCPDVTVVCDPPSGSAFPIGATTVTCTATDTSGNIAQCSFEVIVQLSNRCPQSEAYWRQNPGAWPVNSVRLGGQVYTKSQLLPLLRATLSADASMVLARNLIAATLNTARGSDPRPICGELAQANSVLAAFSGKLPYRVNVASPAGRSMVNLSSVLSGYNSGLLTPNCVP